MVRTADKATGIVIRRLRKNAGVTQQAIAGFIGVSYQQMQKYEKGTNRLSISSLFDICKGLEVKPHTVVRLIEHEYQNQKDILS